MRWTIIKVTLAVRKIGTKVHTQFDAFGTMLELECA
jgi:hypothetical protein